MLAFAPNSQRERLLQPVRMDILKGIIGYRVFFVRKDDLPIFKGHESAAPAPVSGWDSTASGPTTPS